jgi:hypothetical protein
LLVLKFLGVTLKTQLTYPLRTWFFRAILLSSENIRKEEEWRKKDLQAMPPDPSGAALSRNMRWFHIFSCLAL